MDPEFHYGKKTRLSELEFEQTIHLAVTTYGENAQTRMLFEEMSELQNAICKYVRGRDSVDHICEEIADVMIMCRQMALIFGEDNVWNWTNKKMLRLAEQLKTEKL